MWCRSLCLVLPLAISLNSQTSPETIHQAPQLSSFVQQPSTQDATEPEIIDIPVYCAQLSQTVQHSSALANVCQFALSTLKRFPDLICDREMRRHWTEYSALDAIKHSDVLTAEVTYRRGQEYYDHLQLNGHRVSSQAPALPPSSLSGPWSLGEFAMALEEIFLPSSKAEFQFKKQTHFGSAKAELFTFHVAAANNRYYFLFTADQKWFPEFGGELWIDESGLRLLRLHDETAYTDKYPIRSVKTTIDYAPIFLPDGSIVVLPIHSRVSTCTVQEGVIEDNCSRSLVTFTNWHKFKATSTILTNPEH